MAQVRVAEGQTSIFDLLEPQGEHTPGACVFETMRWSKKSCCTLRGSTIWTNCLEWGRCTMRDARKLPEITEEEE